MNKVNDANKLNDSKTIRLLNFMICPGSCTYNYYFLCFYFQCTLKRNSYSHNKWKISQFSSTEQENIGTNPRFIDEI